MAWVYLLLAGVCEIGWPLGFKLASGNPNKLLWIAMSVCSIGLSGVFLYLAQRTIPMGTAYAVWTGIGAAGTFVIGILFFKDAATIARIISVFLILAGVIGLKLSAH
ncbi:MAG: multidrug efflux SMR transporter [Proteobacteria bacterium]|nr:MAG: multidrug efflux SMR transporter [Pseudomonadota bacterium]